MKNNSPLLNKISESISASINQNFFITGQNPVSGGCINTTSILTDGKQQFFIKLNTAGSLSMFEAEYHALLEIARTDTIRAPEPVCTGQHEQHAWLIMEYLPLQSQGHHAQLGEQLAAMHRVSHEYFGWDRENTIGSTPQINTANKDWPTFFQVHRLQYQLELAASKGYTGSLQTAGRKLLECINDFFSGYRVTPSLLHGDLWAGNFSFTGQGEPVIFDPATYYGDRETDIAMTELFGGFTSAFRSSYENCWPLDDGYGARKTLYNCYHILNHLNLFGGGYAAQAENMIMRILSERNG